MGLRDLDPGRRVLNDRAETVHLRTRDPHEALADAVRPRPPARLPRGRADPGRRLPPGRAWSTRSSPTSRRCCSAPVAAPSPTSASAPSPTRSDLTVNDVTVLAGHDGEQPNVRLTMTPHRRRPEMFTGIVEELGTVEHVEDQGDADPPHHRAPPPCSRTPRLGDSIAVNGCCLTVVEHDDDTLDRRRHAGDPRQDLAARRRSPATGSTSSARSPPTSGSAATSSRATSTASARSSPARPASTGRSSRSRCPPQLARYLVDKGSITVDGVSLTVVEAGDDVVHRQPDPRDPRPHHPRLPPARRPGQPRDRRHRQARREAHHRRLRRAPARGPHEGEHP